MSDTIHGQDTPAAHSHQDVRDLPSAFSQKQPDPVCETPEQPWETSNGPRRKTTQARTRVLYLQQPELSEKNRKSERLAR
jgi:hypothetical protein